MNDISPVFSVIYLTYNQESYVEQTLDSIISQEHNYPYEIIIGDDGSTDDTRKIISNYAERYPEIIKTIFNEHNLGVIKNYYNVIVHCRGKYILECGGDDWWLPGKVAQQIEFMESHPDVGMSYGKVYNFYNGKKSSNSNWLVNEKFEDFMISNSVPALTVCVRLELVQKYIKDVNPVGQSWLMEDYPMWIWFSHESKIKFIDSYMGCYRILEGSISHSGNIKKQAIFFADNEAIRKYFSEKYNYPVKLIEGTELQFCYAYVQSLSRKYNKKVANEFRSYYKNNCKGSNTLGQNSKMKVYNKVAFGLFTWKLFTITQDIRMKIKKFYSFRKSGNN